MRLIGNRSFAMGQIREPIGASTSDMAESFPQSKCSLNLQLESSHGCLNLLRCFPPKKDLEWIAVYRRRWDEGGGSMMYRIFQAFKTKPCYKFNSPAQRCLAGHK